MLSKLFELIELYISVEINIFIQSKSMAWGIWNKIKNGIKKVVGGVGNAASWVNDKVVKPVIKPVVGALAPVLDTFIPGLGTTIKHGVDVGSDCADRISPKLKDFGSNGGGVRRIPQYF
jgi:phage-related protein